MSEEVLNEEPVVEETPAEETPAEEETSEELPLVDVSIEAIEDLLIENESNLKELSKQIQKAKIAEMFFSSRLQLGKPNATSRMEALAQVQGRIKSLAGQYNEQADFSDFLKEKKQSLL